MIAQPFKKLFCEVSFTDEIDWLTIKTAERTPDLEFTGDITSAKGGS